jgi:microcystin-dependent protein
MSNYLGEIRQFAFGVVPQGWAQCNGQILPRNKQNEPLFSLLGKIYGGDGQTNFALPNLQGRVPLHCGIVPSTMVTYTLGDAKGETGHVLTASEVLSHTHTVNASAAAAVVGVIGGQEPGPTVVLAQALAAQTAGGTVPASLYATGPANVQMAPNTITTVGGQAHENQQPYLPLNFCIALSGIFPSRT